MTDDAYVAETARALALDALAAILPMDRRDALAAVLTDDDVATLKHLANEGIGDNSLRALASDLAYLEAWSLAATGNPLPWPAPEAMALKFVAHHLFDPEKREADAAHGMPAEVEDVLESEGTFAQLRAARAGDRQTPPRPLGHVASLARVRRPLRRTDFARRAAPGRAGLGAAARAQKPKGGDARRARAIARRLRLEPPGGFSRQGFAADRLRLRRTAPQRNRAAAARTDYSRAARPARSREPRRRSPALPVDRARPHQNRIGRRGDARAADRAAGRGARGLDRKGGNCERRGVSRHRPLGNACKTRRSRRRPSISSSSGAASRPGSIPDAFSAHGLRSGFLTEAARRGVPLPEAMRQSQHRSVQQAARYYNDAEARLGAAARLLV